LQIETAKASMLTPTASSINSPKPITNISPFCYLQQWIKKDDTHPLPQICLVN
jgi:hypothetical protein